MIPPETSHSTRFHTIAVVAGLAEVAGILRFLVLRPSWSRGALSASSSLPRLRSPRNQRPPLRFRGYEERAIAEARVEVGAAAVTVVGCASHFEIVIGIPTFSIRPMVV
jgi:hypothetical protein